MIPVCEVLRLSPDLLSLFFEPSFPLFSGANARPWLQLSDGLELVAGERGINPERAGGRERDVGV